MKNTLPRFYTETKPGFFRAENLMGNPAETMPPFYAFPLFYNKYPVPAMPTEPILPGPPYVFPYNHMYPVFGYQPRTVAPANAHYQYNSQPVPKQFGAMLPRRYAQSSRTIENKQTLALPSSADDSSIISEFVLCGKDDEFDQLANEFNQEYREQTEAKAAVLIDEKAIENDAETGNVSSSQQKAPDATPKQSRPQQQPLPPPPPPKVKPIQTNQRIRNSPLHHRKIKTPRGSLHCNPPIQTHKPKPMPSKVHDCNSVGEQTMKHEQMLNFLDQKYKQLENELSILKREVNFIKNYKTSTEAQTNPPSNRAIPQGPVRMQQPLLDAKSAASNANSQQGPMRTQQQQPQSFSGRVPQNRTEITQISEQKRERPVPSARPLNPYGQQFAPIQRMPIQRSVYEMAQPLQQQHHDSIVYHQYADDYSIYMEDLTDASGNEDAQEHPDQMEAPQIENNSQPKDIPEKSSQPTMPESAL